MMGRLLASPLFRVAFGLLGLGFLAVAFLAAWDRSMADVVPPWPALLLALSAVTAGHLASALGWVALFDRSGSTRRLVHGLFVAQFGKYIPGGVWQVIGQVGLAVGPGVSAARAATAFPVHVVVQVVAAAAVAAPLAVFASDAPALVRLAALAGVALLPLLHRRWMAGVAARIRRWRGLDGVAAPVPSQTAVLRAFAWSAVGIAAAGLGFALLLQALGGSDSLAVGTTAFGLAWLVGFLALPFPSGIGVREAVMLAALGSGAGLVVAASLAHRLVLISAEALLALLTWRPR